MRRQSAFKHCGQCGSTRVEFDGEKRHHCPACGWVYFRNPVAAVAALFLKENNILLVRRGKAPGRGKLGFPGGFVDFGETAEQALDREVREELGIKAPPMRYFGNWPNIYEYAGVVYETVDLYYSAGLTATIGNIDREEISEIVWRPLANVDPEQLAFESARCALDYFREHLH